MHFFWNDSVVYFDIFLVYGVHKDPMFPNCSLGCWKARDMVAVFWHLCRHNIFTRPDLYFQPTSIRPYVEFTGIILEF